MPLSRSPWPLIAAISATLIIWIAALVTADTRRPGENEPPARPTSNVSYVAIGDSYTAGGPIGVAQPAADGCLRSSFNYPSLVARDLNYNLTDVSCVGATTKSVVEGTAALPPQVERLSSKTDIVTVSIGGNDLRIFADIFMTCFRTSRPSSAGAPCRAEASRRLATKAPDVLRRVGTVLDEVRRSAPEARIVAITYLRLMPADQTCGATPFSRLDVSWLADVEKATADTISAAAAARDIEVLDMYERSAGHELCAKDPWVNGARPKPRNGLLFHPNAAGEHAIAIALAEQLRERDDD